VPGEALEEELRAGLFQRRRRATRVPGRGRGRALVFGNVNGEEGRKERERGREGERKGRKEDGKTMGRKEKKHETRTCQRELAFYDFIIYYWRLFVFTFA
jgi:hypothetical protein